MKSPTKCEIEHFLSQTYRNKDSSTHINSDYWNSFVQEIKELDQFRKEDQIADFRHLKKMKLWGRLVSGLGLLTGWVLPNPISACLLALGNYTRWALVFHPISHGSMDHIEGISQRYKSDQFALGWRRYTDWLDWIEPKNWNVEHNLMHHHYLGTSKDPDIVSRNTQAIRELNIPIFGKKIFSLLLAGSWKFSYYAPNTLIEYRNFHDKSKTTKITPRLWNPFLKEGREVWVKSIIPYFIFKFVLIPSLFLVINKNAALYILINSIFAEVITNIYSFCTIATNHTGDDVVTFAGGTTNKADYYLRQIIGSVNYPSQNDFQDFCYGGMNYQIEHHVWPSASVYQCQKLRPKLKEICIKYKIPYREEPLGKRIVKLMNAITLPEGGEIELTSMGSVKC